MVIVLRRALIIAVRRQHPAKLNPSFILIARPLPLQRQTQQWEKHWSPKTLVRHSCHILVKDSALPPSTPKFNVAYTCAVRESQASHRPLLINVKIGGAGATHDDHDL